MLLGGTLRHTVLPKQSMIFSEDKEQAVATTRNKKYPKGYFVNCLFLFFKLAVLLQLLLLLLLLS